MADPIAYLDPDADPENTGALGAPEWLRRRICELRDGGDRLSALALMLEHHESLHRCERYVTLELLERSEGELERDAG